MTAEHTPTPKCHNRSMDRTGSTDGDTCDRGYYLFSSINETPQQKGGVFLSVFQIGLVCGWGVVGGWFLSMARMRSQRRRATQMTAALRCLPSDRLRW